MWVLVVNGSRGSGEEEQPPVLPPLALATVLSYCVLIGITISGNLLVILGFWKDPTLQAITNYWIVSLSLTDICLASTVLPLQLAREINRGLWAYGELWCDVFTCLDVLCCTCSIYHLALISLDRYLCIRFPIAYPSLRTSQRTILAILLTWLFCTLLAMPRLLGWKDQFLENDCEIRNKSYTLFSSLVSFYIPLFLIMCMYVGIYRATQARTNRFRRELLASQRVVAAMRKNRAESVPVIPLSARTSTTTATNHQPSLGSIWNSESTEKSFQSNVNPKRNVDPDLETIPEGTATGYGNNSDESRSTFGTRGQDLDQELELMTIEDVLPATDTGTPVDPSPVTPGSSLRKRIRLLQNVRDVGRRLASLRPLFLTRSQTADWLPRTATKQQSCDQAQPQERRYSTPFGDEDEDRSVLHSDPNLSAQETAAALPTNGDEEAPSTSLTTISKPNMVLMKSSAAPICSVSVRKQEKRVVSHTTSDAERRKRKLTQAKLKRRRQKQENRTARVVVIVLGAFVIFWGPFFVLNVILPWCGTACLGEETQAVVWKWAVFWGYVNSAINPFIYTFFNRTFRRAICSVLKCEKRRRH